MSLPGILCAVHVYVLRSISCFLACLLAAAAPTLFAKSLAICDCAGILHYPLELEGRKAAVFIFISTECPISNSLAPDINRIVSAYTNFAFYLVHADTDLRPRDALRHKQDFQLQAPVLLDPKHELVK